MLKNGVLQRVGVLKFVDQAPRASFSPRFRPKARVAGFGLTRGAHRATNRQPALAAAFLLGQRMVDVGEQIDLQGNQRVFFGHVFLIQIMAEIGQGLQAGECGCIGALAFLSLSSNMAAESIISLPSLSCGSVPVAAALISPANSFSKVFLR